MKKSIKHLPKRTQEELNIILALIKLHVPKCHMVILYGSYARGEYVLWDQRVEFDRQTFFQSDLDIMVVTSHSDTTPTSRMLEGKVTNEYERVFEPRRHAPSSFIVERIAFLNKRLENSHYFYTDVIKEGIMLYDSEKYELAKPKKLSYNEIRDIAVSEFEMTFPYASTFLKTAHFNYSEGDYVIGSFLLHQACERFYNAVDLVFTNYRPKTHDLEKLKSRIKRHSRELATVFPLNTDFEKRCYDLLCKAYIEARYNKYFVVTKEELEYLLSRVEIMKEVTERICTEKIKEYDSLIEIETNSNSK